MFGWQEKIIDDLRKRDENRKVALNILIKHQESVVLNNKGECSCYIRINRNSSETSFNTGL